MLRRECDSLIELDLGGYFGLVLVTGLHFELVRHMGQCQLVHCIVMLLVRIGHRKIFVGVDVLQCHPLFELYRRVLIGRSVGQDQLEQTGGEVLWLGLEEEGVGWVEGRVLAGLGEVRK